jgi:hypothetical protein
VGAELGQVQRAEPLPAGHEVGDGRLPDHVRVDEAGENRVDADPMNRAQLVDHRLRQAEHAVLCGRGVRETVAAPSTPASDEFNTIEPRSRSII